MNNDNNVADNASQDAPQNKLFVGNLPWSVGTDQLREMFEEAGEITDAIVLTDKFTGRSKGFGFVTFSTDEEAQAAIEAFNEKEIEGRNLVVNVARPKTDRPRRDFGGDRRGGNRNGGFNNRGGGYNDRRRDY